MGQDLYMEVEEDIRDWIEAFRMLLFFFPFIAAFNARSAFHKGGVFEGWAWGVSSGVVLLILVWGFIALYLDKKAKDKEREERFRERGKKRKQQIAKRYSR